MRLLSCANGSESTALHSAASNGRLHLVELLLKARADVRQKDADSETALDVRLCILASGSLKFSYFCSVATYPPIHGCIFPST